MKLLSCLKPSYTVNLLSIIIWKWMWVHFTGMLLQYKSRPTPVEPKPYWQVACLVNINFLVNMYSKWWCIIQNLPTHTLVMNVKEWDFYIVPVHFLQLSETRWLVIRKALFHSEFYHALVTSDLLQVNCLGCLIGWQRYVKGRWACVKRAHVRIETQGNSGALWS